MKYLIITLNFLLPFVTVTAQNNLSVSGKTDAFEEGDTVSISPHYPFNTFFSNPGVYDSSIIKDGKFSLSLKEVNSEFFDISIKRKKRKEVTTRIFLEPSPTKIVFKDSLLENRSVNGNKAADDYASFSTEVQKVKPPRIYSTLWKEYDAVRNINPGLAQKIFVRIDSILKVMSQNTAVIGKEWMNNHPRSFLNSYILYNFLRSHISDDSLKKKFYQLPVEVRKNSWGRELQYILSNVIVGVKAPSFAQNDTSGNEISLSDFTGKGEYILLDFWASWCAPCREKNPALRGIYNDLKNKNFTIIGISLDKSKEGWIEAIKKDSLPWPQISDLQFWNNKAAQAYYIRAIPSNFLLDPKGEIIAKDLSSTELHKKLTGLLK